MAGGDHGVLRRRWQRLIKMKEATGAWEEDRILKLKRELEDLMEIRRHRRRLKEEALSAVGACDPPPPPCDPLSSAERAGKKRKVVKTTVPQELIDFYILNPRKAFDGFREEKLGKCPLEFRETYFLQKAIADKLMEYRQVIIKQFRNKGFAEDYEEVFTDEGEGENEEKGEGKDAEKGKGKDEEN